MSACATGAVTLSPTLSNTTAISTWTSAEGGVNGVVINETNNGFEAGIDRVEVIIPNSQAVAGKIFARLKVEE